MFTLTFLLGTATYKVGSVVNPVSPEWVENMKANCGSQYGRVNKTTDPELYSYEKFLPIFALVGSYIGLIFEQKVLDTHMYAEWNQIAFLE